jgi:hypothetical protein
MTVGVGGPTVAAAMGTWAVDRFNRFNLPLLGVTIRLRRAALLCAAPIAFAVGLPRCMFVRVYNDTGRTCEIANGDARVAIAPHEWELHWMGSVVRSGATVTNSPCVREGACVVASPSLEGLGTAAACPSASKVPIDEEPPMRLLNLDRIVFQCGDARQLIDTRALQGGCPVTEDDGGICALDYRDGACARLAQRSRVRLKATWFNSARAEPFCFSGSASPTSDSTVEVSLPGPALDIPPASSAGYVDLCILSAEPYRFEWQKPGVDESEDDKVLPRGFVSARWRTAGSEGRMVLPARTDPPAPIAIRVKSDVGETLGTLTCPPVGGDSQRCLYMTHIASTLPEADLMVDGSKYETGGLADHGPWTCVPEAKGCTYRDQKDQVLPSARPIKGHLAVRTAPQRGQFASFPAGRLPLTLDIAIGGEEQGTLECPDSDAGSSVLVLHAVEATKVRDRKRLTITQTRALEQQVSKSTSIWTSAPIAAHPHPVQYLWACERSLGVSTFEATLSEDVDGGVIVPSTLDSTTWILSPKASPSTPAAEQDLPCIRNPRTGHACPSVDPSICEFRGRNLSSSCPETWFCPCP